MQLLRGHPELDGEGTRAEGRSLIKALDGALGTLDVFEEHEVLAIGSGGVEVLALAHFN